MTSLSNGCFSRNTIDSPSDEEVDREVENEWEMVDERGFEKEKEKGKCTPPDEAIKLRIKKYKVKNRFEKRTRIQREYDRHKYPTQTYSTKAYSTRTYPTRTYSTKAYP